MMASIPMNHRSGRAVRAAFAVLLASLALVRCGSGGGDISAVEDHPDPDSVAAAGPGVATDTLRLATLNMSIGFPVTQLVVKDMDNDTVAYDELTKLYATYLRGNPRERVKAMARAIVAESLDVVGLQEVMAIDNGDSLVNDFLPELVADIAAAGGPAFHVFRAVMNDTTLQGIKGGDTITISFREGHAVLVDPRIQVLDSVHIPYSRGNLLPIYGGKAYSERGTDYLRLRTPAGVEFQVFNTHLEVGVFRQFQNRQASQLARIADSLALPVDGGGPWSRKLQVVLGDLNASPRTAAQQILRDHNFVDAWEGVGEGDGFTCCVDGSALWSPDSNIVDERIDYVLARGLVRRLGARTAVKEPFTAAGGKKFLASDHRMVIAEILAR